jgi:hypothetical protein
MLSVFKAKNIGFYVKFNDSPAAREIIGHLPLMGFIRTWGDEIYFETKISAPDTGKTMNLNVGDVAYWPEGKGICVFFGKTMASTSGKPVPASPVVVIGKTMAAADELREIEAGEPISVFVMSKSAEFEMNPTGSDDTRKLSQAEIDALVKQLLEEKKRRR